MVVGKGDTEGELSPGDNRGVMPRLVFKSSARKVKEKQGFEFTDFSEIESLQLFIEHLLRQTHLLNL